MKFVAVGIYVAILLVIAFFSMKKTKTLNDFFLGNRSIGPWVSAFAYGTTYFSAVLFIGYAGKVGWGFGISTLWIVLGNAAIGSFLAWKLLAKKTRAMTVTLSSVTMPGFLEKRYQSKNLKIVAALIIFVFLVPYSASVYMGLSYFFESVFGIPYLYALVFMAIMTAIYLTMGGYFAITLTDFFQGIVMIIGVFLLLFFVVTNPQVGGLSNVLPSLAAVDPRLASPIGPPGGVALFSLVILTSLGPWGLPQMIHKFYSIKNEKVISTATWATTAFALIIATGAYFTGSLSHLFISDLSEVGNNVDRIMPAIINSTVPEAMAVLILLLVLAASMSTLASLVLVSSSSIAVDLLQSIRPKTDQSTSVLIMRILSVLFIAFSLYLAVTPNIILNLMAFSWGTVAGAFIGPYLFGLLYKKTTKAGAWSGLLTGSGFCIVFSIFYPDNVPLVGSLAMVLSILVVPVVSAFTTPMPQEHITFVFNEE
ncbi:MAG: sodium:solute symporter [Gracilibacter sp. BRH_c7a]|nr:MAG: sodium:solute symporter [Gracilibacter sp. BRH_c7a]